MKMVPWTMGLALGIAASLVQAASHRIAERHLRRALALNPAFDVRQGPTARATLDTLENPRLARADERGAR
jgi:hypothetical protein